MVRLTCTMMHLSFIMSNSVNSYDKNTRVAMVAYTPQQDTSSGSKSFDKDSFRTIGLPWQLYTLGYMDPGCLGCMGIVHCGGVFDPSQIMVQVCVCIHVCVCVW